MKKKRFIIFILFLFIAPIFAGTLHNQSTVYLVPNGYSSVEFYQKIYYAPDGNYLLNRNQKILLAFSKDLEFGIDIPYINYIKQDITISNLGDIKFHLNYATPFLKKYMKINYYFELNTGNGPKYNEADINPMLNYGYQELKIGVLNFKKFKYFSLHFNILYVIKSEKELTLFDVIQNGLIPKSWEDWYSNKANLALLGAGVITYVNPLETYLLGKNSKDIANEINQKNTIDSQDEVILEQDRYPVENDNIEYLLSINSDLPYPFVPYIEFLFAHDLFFKKSSQYFKDKTKRQGSGYLNIQLSIGTKFFLLDENLIINSAIIIPLGEIREIVSIGYSLGLKMNF